jgi:DNA repair protein RecN (Recombination protein N)
LAFYGQHEHRRLTLASAQLETLDGFAGEEHLERRRRYRAAHTEVLRIERELAEIRDRQGARERDIDLLRFELDEIESAEFDAAEEQALSAERERLRHVEALRQAATGALGAVSGTGEDDGGATGAAGVAESALAAVDGVDEPLDALAERARGLALELRELGNDLRAYADGVDAEPGRLQQVEERLDVIDRLQRKHGGSVEAVLAHADRCRAEIERIEGSEERSEELERELELASRKRAQLAEELTATRRQAASGLEERVASELEQLAMSGAELEVGLEEHPDGFGASGRERVEFRVATNPGLPISPLRDAASGGELSRVMLALARQGSRAGAATFVFDEIDAGIGGNTARAVGERLRELGSERQVLCITHLPQVASLAEKHFRIEKRVKGETATATVKDVDGDELVAEIVRMLGADRGDETASKHARELLQAA